MADKDTDQPDTGDSTTPPDTGSSDAGTVTEPQGSPDTTADELTAAKAEVDKWKSLARKHEKQAKTTRTEGESELSGLHERITQLEADKASAQRQALTAKVASEAGLPASFASRLQGQDEAELRSDAAQLVEVVRTNAPTPAVGGTQGAAPSAARTPEEWRTLLRKN